MKAVLEWLREWWAPVFIISMGLFGAWAIHDDSKKAEARKKDKRSFCYQHMKTFDDFERCVK